MKPGDTWHWDKVVLPKNGELRDVSWAVDRHDVVLDILVQDRSEATRAL